METPRLIINKDISQFDLYAEMFGDPQPVFSSNTLIDFLDENKEATEIEVDIMSDGGSTSEARVIYDLLKNCGKKVTTRGFKVNSSAVMIFLAGEQRLIAENADFLVHPVWIDAMGLPWMLTGEDLQYFADEIKAEEKKLLDLYVSVIGEDKREELTQLMSDSTNLSNDKAIELGFATGKLEEAGTTTENKRAVSFNNNIAALVLKNRKSNQNSEEMKGLKDTLANLNKTLNKLLNKDGEEISETTETQNQDTETQNASVELAEGGSVYFDGELGEGVAVFTDEAMESPAPDGEHALADGRSIEVSEGVVTSVSAAAAEEENKEDAPKTENSEVGDLKNRLEAIEKNQADTTKALNDIAETFKNQNSVFETLQNLVPGETGGESTPRKRKKEPTVYSEMTNLERKRHNKKK